MDGDFNSGEWQSDAALLNQRVCKISTDEGFYDKKFLGYLLPGYLKSINDNTPSVTVKHLSSKTIGDIDLPLPPRKEQTRIVEKLEELLSDLDAGVAELKAAQRKLGQYRQSLLKAAVEGALTAQWRAQHTPTETGAQLLERILTERRARWEARQLAKFEAQGKAPPKDWRKKYPEPVRPDTRELPALPEGWAWASLDQFLYQLRSGTAETSGRDATAFPVLKSSAVRQGHIDWEALNYLGSHQIREDNFLEEGDFLITRLSGSVEYVGCCAIAGKIPEEGMQYPDRIFCGKLAVRDKEIAYYLMHCLFSPQARILIEAAAKSTAGHKRISLSDLFPFPVPLPPESELKVICHQMADSLDQIWETGKAVETSLKQSAAQRKNILKAAFSGQLVPQDPDDESAAVLLERIRAERVSSAGGRGRKGRPAASDRSHAC